MTLIHFCEHTITFAPAINAIVRVACLWLNLKLLKRYGIINAHLKMSFLKH